MKNFKIILTEKQQKTSALSPGKIDKYEYLTGEEILPTDKSRIIEQDKSTCSLLGKALKKKTIKDRGRKQIGAIINQNDKRL